MNFEIKNESWIGNLTTIVLLFSFVLFSCSSDGEKRKGNQNMLEIPVLELLPSDVEVPQTYIADIQAIQFVEVRSKVEGFVDQIFVDEGQFVKKGQKLFQLSSAEYNEMVNSARANLARAQAEQQASKVEVERLQTLVDKKHNLSLGTRAGQVKNGCSRFSYSGG